MKGQSNTEGKGVVYCIENMVNHRKYIGQTIDLKRRLNEHKTELMNNKHKNKNLQQDFNLYTVDSFTYYILEYCSCRKQLIERETYWINYYGGIENENIYNMQDMLHCNKQMCLLNSNGQKGKQISQETKAKISKTEKAYYKCNGGKYEGSFKGKHHTAETKLILSELKKQEHLTNTNYGMTGKKHTEQAKEKMRQKGLQRADRMRQINTKYTPDFVKELKEAYIKLGTYKKVAEIYNLDTSRVCDLIKYGTTSKNKKCNDYPVKEYTSSEVEAQSNLIEVEDIV